MKKIIKFITAFFVATFATTAAWSQVVTSLVDGDSYYIQCANTSLSERNLYWDNNNLRTRSDATPLSVIFKAHQVEEDGQTYWTFEITSNNYKGYYLGRTNDNGANARAVGTDQKYLWKVTYGTGDEGSGFVLLLKGEEDQERRALMMNGSANWVCAYYDETNDKTANTSHWIFTKVEGVQSVQQPTSDYVVDITIDKLVEANNFSDNGETTRFRSPKYWTVENFDVDCGGDGHKQGVDRHPGYNCLQLGTWDQNGNAQDNSRLYKEVTLPAGEYYFGAKYHAIESGANDNNFLFATTTNPSNSLTKDNIQNSLAWAPMAGSSANGNYHGIYFELTEETTLYLGWLANSTVWHSEFRASDITLRKTTTNPGVQEAKQLLSTYATDLTTDKLVEANNFSATDMGSRYGTPVNWTVEDYGFDHGDEGLKNGIDNYPGYKCLQLGRWEETATANMENSRLYHQVTLPAGKYYFGAMYESLPNESKQNTIMFAATNPQSLTIGNVYDNALACARMDNAGTSGTRYFGIYFELTEETTLYLGWLTNSTVKYSEFRARAVTLRKMGEDQGALTTPWTQLTELPAVADYGKYFYVIKDNPRNLIMIADNVGNSDQNQVRGVKSMWYAKNINVGENKKALWTFDDYDATYQVLTNASYQNCVFQTEWGTHSCFHAGDNLFDDWSRAEFKFQDGAWTIRNVYHGEEYLGPMTDGNFDFSDESQETYFNKTQQQYIGHFNLFSIPKGLYVKTYENTAAASAEHPIDLTYIVDNPGAERYGRGRLRGWINASEWAAQGNEYFDKVGSRYFEKQIYNSGGGLASDIYQEFTDLPAGFYRFSAIALGGEGLQLYANDAVENAPTGSSARVYVIGEVTNDGILRIGAKAFNVTDDWVKFDDVKLEYLYEEAPTSTIGTPTWNVVVDGYIPQPIDNITATFDGAMTNTGAEFTILNASAAATLSEGTNSYTGTLSLSGKILTMEFANFTIETGKTYTVTLPAGTVGYEGQVENEAYIITFHTPCVFEGRYYLYNQKANSFLGFNSDEEYTRSTMQTDGKVFGLHIQTTTGDITMQFDNELWQGGNYWGQTDHVARTFYLVPATNGYYICRTNADVGEGNIYMYVTEGDVGINGNANNIQDMADATWVFVPEEKKITLEDTSESAPMGGDNMYVTFYRTFKAGIWNTVCLPFDMVIPDGWTVKTLASSTYNSTTENISMHFEDVSGTTLTAGVPYMVQPEEETTVLVAGDVTVLAEPSRTETDNIDFVGTFAKQTLPEASYYIQNNIFYQVGENQEVNMKGFRAYLEPKAGITVKSINYNVDGEALSIEDIDGVEIKNDAQTVYDLSGRAVKTPARGLYIINGKKVIIK